MRIAFLLFLLAACSAVADEGNRTVLAKGLFSYQAPPGWQVGPQANSRFDVATHGRAANYGTILVSIEPFSHPLSAFIQIHLRTLRHDGPVHIVSRRRFITNAGIAGVRIVTKRPLPDGTPTMQILYFFDAGASQKILVEASCAEDVAVKDEPLFDAALKTFTLE